MTVDQSYKRAKLQDHWDAIVIGSGIGGLTPAAMLARKGWRVLVLERHAVAGGCTHAFKREGYEWDVGLHYMGEVHRKNGGLRRIFDFISNDKLEWAPMPDVYNRVVIADRNYDFVTGAERFKERMKEYFPNDTVAIDRYLELVMAANRVAKDFFGERAIPSGKDDAMFAKVGPAFLEFSGRTVLEVLNGLTTNQELIAVLCGHYGDYSLLPSKASFAMHAMLIKHYIDGASYPVGGASRIAETIGDVIRAAGGAVLVAAEVSQVLMRDGKACGVIMRDGRELLAPVVLSDAGITRTVNQLLPADVAESTGLVEKCRSAEVSQAYLALNIGIKESNATLGIDPANIWAHPGPDLVANLAAYEADPRRQPLPMHFISVPSAKDPTWEQRYPGRTTVDICSLTSWSLFEKFTGTNWMKRGAGYDELKLRLREEMLEGVMRFYPQLRGKIDHAELATPLSFNHFLGREKGDFMSFAHTPQRFSQRWMRAHSPIPGLYFTGQDVAAAGLSGAIVGGMVATSAVLGTDAFQELHTGGSVEGMVRSA